MTTTIRCVGQPRRGNLWDPPFRPMCGWVAADVMVYFCPYCGGQVDATDWRSGYRHCVEDVSPASGWKCVWCGQWFDAWPSDLLECPGPQTRALADPRDPDRDRGGRP